MGGVKRSVSEVVRGASSDLASWHAALGRGRPPFHRPGATGQGDFAGRFRRHLLDQVGAQLIEIRAREHSVSRTAREISTMDGPYFLVYFQLAGHGVFRQEGAAGARLGPGDYVLSTTDTPYTLGHVGDFALFSLRFPQSFIDVPERLLRPLMGKTLSSRDGFGKHLAPFVSSVARDGELLSGPAGPRVARNLIDLLGTGVAELLERTERERDRPVPLLSLVTEYIERNLADPALSASAVAAGCYISPRYLQALFHDQGTTVTDWIRARRLALCQRDLADPALRDVAISEIARRRGYPDPTYFARLFRRAHGESPREWRARAAIAWPLAPAGPAAASGPVIPGSPVIASGAVIASDLGTSSELVLPSPGR